MLLFGDYATGQGMKFYHLPPDPPEDRHRWFFRESEARNFLIHNASKAGFSITQIDAEGDNLPLGGRGVKGFLVRQLLRRLFRSDIETLSIHHGTLWAVMQKV